MLIHLIQQWILITKIEHYTVKISDQNSVNNYRLWYFYFVLLGNSNTQQLTRCSKLSIGVIDSDNKSKFHEKIWGVFFGWLWTVMYKLKVKFKKVRSWVLDTKGNSKFWSLGDTYPNFIIKKWIHPPSTELNLSHMFQLKRPIKKKKDTK